MQIFNNISLTLSLYFFGFLSLDFISLNKLIPYLDLGVSCKLVLFLIYS